MVLATLLLNGSPPPGSTHFTFFTSFSTCGWCPLHFCYLTQQFYQCLLHICYWVPYVRVVLASTWATLDLVNVNDILKPFGIIFKGDHPDGNAVGGYSASTAVTREKYKIPYHGARLVEGGTPFAYSDKDKENPFGVYKEMKGGGKIVAMGEGMVSLYMTTWQEVNDYQCSGYYSHRPFQETMLD